MGYIKPTSRKVDHVVKLTNGSNVLALEASGGDEMAPAPVPVF